MKPDTFGTSKHGKQLVLDILAIQDKTQQQKTLKSCMGLFADTCRTLRFLYTLPTDVSTTLAQLWMKECIRRAQTNKTPQRIQNLLVALVRAECRPVITELNQYLRIERSVARMKLPLNQNIDPIDE